MRRTGQHLALPVTCLQAIIQPAMAWHMDGYYKVKSIPHQAIIEYVHSGEE